MSTTSKKYVTLSQENFASEVLESENPVLVDFWAEWCAPCRVIGPVIEELAADFEGKATIGKVNVDENSELAAEYGIRSIPSLIFFKGGKVVEQIVGSQSKGALAGKLNGLLAQE